MLTFDPVSISRHLQMATVCRHLHWVPPSPASMMTLQHMLLVSLTCCLM